MNSLILQKQEEVIALAQFDIKDAVLKKCLLKEDETVITVPDGVTTIGKDALCGLQSVIAVTLPESLKVINDGAFYGCSSLTSVTLPGSVERLGSCAFASAVHSIQYILIINLRKSGILLSGDAQALKVLTFPQALLR